MGHRADQVEDARGRIGGAAGVENHAIAGADSTGGAEPAGAKAARRAIGDIQCRMITQRQGAVRSDDRAKLGGKGIDRRRAIRGQRIIVVDDRRVVVVVRRRRAGARRIELRGRDRLEVIRRRIRPLEGHGIRTGIDETIGAAAALIDGFVGDRVEPGVQGDRSHRGFLVRRGEVDQRHPVDVEQRLVVRAAAEEISARRIDLQEAAEAGDAIDETASGGRGGDWHRCRH